MRYVDYCYEIVIEECVALDYIYEDYIEFLVGTRGLLELIKNGCLESCSVVNGIRLYVLVDKDTH